MLFLLTKTQTKMLVNENDFENEKDFCNLNLIETRKIL